MPWCKYFQDKACPETTVPAVAEQSRCLCCMLLIGLAGGRSGFTRLDAIATIIPQAPDEGSGELVSILIIGRGSGSLSSTFTVG